MASAKLLGSSDDELVTKTVFGGADAPISDQTFFFRSRSSGTASITRSASETASATLVVVVMDSMALSKRASSKVFRSRL
ncbi:unannotated protein [freshwater metagenome]|uniref:Unannotated protein n=1 Tax=freshwater metagenome TaxID=449393 RepID=A0A6J7GZZ4_9ZZZZ